MTVAILVILLIFMTAFAIYKSVEVEDSYIIMTDEEAVIGTVWLDDIKSKQDVVEFLPDYGYQRGNTRALLIILGERNDAA